jgi:o-succinylbenzoate---CoA ligase
MTEMASQITTTKSQSLQELQTSGSVLASHEVKILEGQIYVRGLSRFSGYRHGQDVEKPFDAEGWFKTKDRGEWTKEGYLRILGRLDRLFVSAGENIQPEFIEQAILDFPGVLRARVIPEKNEEYGFSPRAFVSFEGELDLNKLKIFLRERLTGLQVPKQVQEWSLMPNQYRNSKDL